MAPALANVIGPVLAGALIDLGGFRAAYAVMAVLPLGALLMARRVPKEPRRGGGVPARRAWDLLRTPGLRRLLAVNWLLSSKLGRALLPRAGAGPRARLLGLGDRPRAGRVRGGGGGGALAIPLIAHHLREGQVLTGCMLPPDGRRVRALPVRARPWAMGLLAAALGWRWAPVQPMIASTLHS